ncbi:hypothetical protein AMATHDRAFT_6757 [Amanita thiersii Skay4041]|uniref:Uncharacterized protein n=1 Tax=Amanita thiersii Skay4041 TaxID=703135 RepID=A0A2A9NI89_9AGAR|nr:hypothetical protein AMATHDRAFT_6757 [Amanita thiersii Skay4041]
MDDMLPKYTSAQSTTFSPVRPPMQRRDADMRVPFLREQLPPYSPPQAGEHDSNPNQIAENDPPPEYDDLGGMTGTQAL